MNLSTQFPLPLGLYYRARTETLTTKNRLSSEGEKACVLRLPLVETFHHGFHQALGHAPVPQIRANRQWREETDTAPVSGKIEPTSSLLISAAKAAFGLAFQRVRT